MKHGKKILSLLLTLVLLVGVLPGMTAFADVRSGFCGDDVIWSYDTTTNTLTISGSGAMKDYNNNSPTPWNNDTPQIKKVVITEGVTTIGNGAFSACTSLSSVTIPNGVTTIGNWAFNGCSNLTSVSIPGSVISIGDGAFAVSSLSSVTIPNSVTTIGNSAFCACKSLKSVTIGSGVTTIGDWAFGGNNSLSSVTFVPGAADNRVAIGDGAFDSTATLAYGAGSTRLFKGNTEIEAGTALDKLNNETLTWKSTAYTVTYDPGEGSGKMEPTKVEKNAEGKFMYKAESCGFTAPRAAALPHPTESPLTFGKAVTAKNTRSAVSMS